jgi:poly(3-hydroxyalkanoate) synthetase
VQLYVFSVEPGLVRDVVAAGAAGIVVDWENRGKERRQQGWGTEINRHTPRDLERVRAATGGDDVAHETRLDREDVQLHGRER